VRRGLSWFDWTRAADGADATYTCGRTQHAGTTVRLHRAHLPAHDHPHGAKCLGTHRTARVLPARWTEDRSRHHSGTAVAHRLHRTRRAAWCTHSFKDGEGNRQTETERHRITCINGIGKCVAEHVTKGAMIMVTGRNHYTRWTDNAGQTRYGPSRSTSLRRPRRRPRTNPGSGARNSGPAIGQLPSKAWISTC
jgi:single-stranded DNA-binding protein